MEVAAKKDKAQLLAEGLAAGETMAGAASKAGISTVNRDAPEIALSPKVRKYVRSAVRGRIDVEGSPQGYYLLLRLMRNERTPIGYRIEIAKFFISHSIAAPKAESENVDNEKPITEMTSVELQAFIGKTNSELLARGLLIDATPRLAVDDLI